MTKSDLTREEALRLHYKMWTEMQEKLGDNPTPEERQSFKHDWCQEWAKNNKYNQDDSVPVRANCFLCEYTDSTCKKCPIDWAKAEDIWVSEPYFVTDCTDYYINSDTDYASPYYKFAPISKILAIPEREDGSEDE